MPIAPFAPLVLARVFGVPQEEVAFTMRLSVEHLRRLARDPKHAHRVLIAELEAILGQERAKALEAGCDTP
jgi:hypothetical protein